MMQFLLLITFFNSDSDAFYIKALICVNKTFLERLPVPVLPFANITIVLVKELGSGSVAVCGLWRYI